MNSFQTIANEVYPDYAVEPWVRDPNGQHGDTLAKFIASELDEREDCESIDDAIQRMGTAIDELSAVQMALIKGKAEGVA